MAAAVLVAGSLAGCAEADPGATADPTASGSSSPSTAVDVPAGVELTEPGTVLDLGEAATVPAEPDQNTGTVLEITVERIARASIRDFSSFVLNERTKKSRPYYVDVVVKNLGPDDVGGTGVPLFGMDGTNTLIGPSAFTTPFEPCASTPLPDTFGTGDRARRCLVFLAPDHGTIDTVSFRPDQRVGGITWTGPVSRADGGKPGKGGKAGKDGKAGKGGKAGRGARG